MADLGELVTQSGRMFNKEKTDTISMKLNCSLSAIIEKQIYIVLKHRRVPKAEHAKKAIHQVVLGHKSYFKNFVLESILNSKSENEIISTLLKPPIQ